MSELTAKHLHGNGAKEITVINRTYEKAEELAVKFAGQARAYAQLEHSLTEVDILITSTGARDFVISKAMVEKAMKKRNGKPLFMVDIA